MNALEACAVAHFGDFVYSVGPVFFATTVHIHFNEDNQLVQSETPCSGTQWDG